MVVLAINLVPAGDLKTFVLALDDENENTTKIEYTGTPGDTVKGQIVIMNPSLNPKKIQITLDNLDDDAVSKNDLASSANLYECCREWITLPQGDFYTIEPNQKSVISYEIKIPENAEAKNYYGAFIVNDVSNGDTSAKHHCNIVSLKIMHAFDPNLGMLAGPAGAFDGASEINLYSPVFSVLAALMLATGIALGGRWCMKKFKV